MTVWWGCAESYVGSGRPSRIWAEATESSSVRPDDERTEDGQTFRPYPFNGMGGHVVSGPHASADEAEAAVWDMIEEGEGGWLYWK